MLRRSDRISDMNGNRAPTLAEGVELRQYPLQISLDRVHSKALKLTGGTGLASGLQRGGECVAPREWAVTGEAPSHGEGTPTSSSDQAQRELVGVRLSLLTSKEREALRLVPTYGTILEIAKAIGVSDAAVKLRLNSASKKLGVRGRHAAARLLLAYEQPFPNQHAPIEQVAGAASVVFPEPARDDEQSAVHEVRSAYQAQTGTSTSGLIRRLLFEPGERHDLSLTRRIRIIGVWVLAGLLAFCLFAGMLSELARTMHDLFPRHRY